MNKVHRFYQNTRHVLRSCLLCWSDTISTTERRDVGGKENTAFDREQEMTKQKFLDGEQERILSLSDYQELSLLGKGGFGQVYLVEEKCSEKKFAMKIVTLPLYICNVKTELSVLTLPDLSEFCVKMFAHFETPNYAIFILEYLAINLKDFQNLLSRIPEEAVSFYLAEVSEGMYYLHSRNMIHGDLKLENTMLDWSGHVKLIDFGVACEILINKKCRSVGCLAKEEYFENFNVCFDLRCFGLMLQSLLQGNITLCILRKSCETKTNHQISQLEFLMMKTSVEDNDTFDRNANKYEWISENSYSTTTSLSLEKDRIFDGVSQEAFDLWKALLKTVPLLGSGPSGKKDLQSHVFFEKINWEELRTRITIPPYKFKMTFQDRKNPEGELLICKNADHMMSILLNVSPAGSLPEKDHEMHLRMTRHARTSMENCVPRTRQQWLREKWKGRSRLSRLACVSRPSVSPKKSAANSFTHLRDAHTSHPLRNADIYNVPVTNSAYKNAKKMSSVKVFTDNGFSASIPVDNSTTAASLCLEIAVYIDNLRDITDWCLFEHICDGKLERLIEDHEKIKAVQESWEQRLGGYLVFRKNLHKHDPVLYPERAFASHITNNEDTEAGITGVAKQAKLFLIRDYILSSKKMPDLQNQLYLHQGSQNSGWKKYLTCLRGSGMYYTPHRKLKNPKHLHCFSRLDDVSVYTVLKSHNQLKCPTKFCLGLKPKSSLKSEDFKGLKYLATKDEDMLQKWSLALRLAKFGDQLEENFRMAVRRRQRVDQLTKKC